MKWTLLAVLILTGAMGFSLEDNSALLLRGPKIGKGIEFIGPNAISYESGEYGYRGKTVSVYVVRIFIPTLSTMSAFSCGGTALSSLALGPESKESVFFYDSGENWRVFFAFHRDEEKICPFITNFLARLRFFLGTSGENGSPLPAFVEIK